MSRNVGGSGVVTALESRQVRTCHLFEMTVFNSVENESETLYATDNAFDIVHDAKNYSALGLFLNVTGIEEFTDSRINQVTVQLSGVAENLISTILSYEYIDQPLIIKRAFLSTETVAGTITDPLNAFDDATPSLLADPVIIFEGGAERPQITESQQDNYVIVTIQASSRFSEFQLNSGRHTNPEEQKFYDSTDRLFEQVGKIDQNLVWGLDK